jgi:hypothetical protein
MFQDLEGSDVVVRCEEMLQLGIVLFVKGIMYVINDPLEETFPDGPCGANEVPILLLAFTFVCGHCVVDGWVVRCGFRRDCIGGDAGEFLVLVVTKYVPEKSVVVCH